MFQLRNSVRAILLASGLLLGGMSVVSDSPSAQASPVQKRERHPHIRGAIHELREAKRELETADHDFGGHRVKALEAVDTAIVQLEKCLKFDKK